MSIEKEKQERHPPDHALDSSCLEISTVHSLKVLYLPHFSEKKPETMPKDWPHVEEAIEIVNWVLSLCMEDRLSMEKQPFTNIVLSGRIFLRFSPAITVLLYTPTIL